MIEGGTPAGFVPPGPTGDPPGTTGTTGVTVDDPPPIPLPPPPPPVKVVPGTFVVVGALVVTWKEPETPPIVTVAVDAVEKALLETSLTLTVSPLFTVQEEVTNAPPFTLYSPPATLMTAGALMPETVMGAEVVSVESSALEADANAKAFGTVSVTAAKAKSENCVDWNTQSPAPLTVQLARKA